MKIEVLGSINSGQYDYGDVVEFPDKTAKELIAGGYARDIVKHKEQLESNLKIMESNLQKMVKDVSDTKKALTSERPAASINPVDDVGGKLGKQCACGCGNTVTKVSNKYIQGHQFKKKQ